MKKFRSKKIYLSLGILFLFFAPLILVKSIVHFSSPTKIEELSNADAVIVFGTIVREGQVSPLMKQRLETAFSIYEQKKAIRIVVSNTENASLVMRDYLVEKGVPIEDIELDIGAVRTVDSCIRERKKYGARRTLILVSQNYHLPRIAVQCWRKDLEGEVFAAEHFLLPDSNISVLNVIFIRSHRHLREAALIWFAVFRN